MTAPSPNSKENPWANLAFNVLIPVVVLQQLSRRLGTDGPLIALIVALAFPIAYGVWDWIKFRKRNALSILGVVSVLFTGGFALFELSPRWFAIKEAAFPLAIGLVVFFSSLMKHPFLKSLLLNEQVLNANRIRQALSERGTLPQFDQLVRRATRWSALSFVLSAILNYVVALRVFQDIDAGLAPTERSAQLNDQVAQMTGYGFLVIALPMTLFMGGILWLFLRELKTLTGLGFEELFPHQH